MNILKVCLIFLLSNQVLAQDSDNLGQLWKALKTSSDLKQNIREYNFRISEIYRMYPSGFTKSEDSFGQEINQAGRDFQNSIFPLYRPFLEQLFQSGIKSASFGEIKQSQDCSLASLSDIKLDYTFQEGTIEFNYISPEALFEELSQELGKPINAGFRLIGHWKQKNTHSYDQVVFKPLGMAYGDNMGENIADYERAKAFKDYELFFDEEGNEKGFFLDKKLIVQAQGTVYLAFRDNPDSGLNQPEMDINWTYGHPDNPYALKGLALTIDVPIAEDATVKLLSRALIDPSRPWVTPRIYFKYLDENMSTKGEPVALIKK